MTAEQLFLAAALLHRRVLRLVPAPGDPVAVWYADHPGREHGQQPWLAVDLSRHPDDHLRRAGVLRVAVDPSELTAAVSFDPGPLPLSGKGEVTLSAVAVEELPPPDILFSEGPPTLREWVATVAALGHDVSDGWGYPSFPFQSELDGYARAYQASHALYAQQSDERQVYAQLGGWPFNWPEAGGVEQLGRRLVLRTYRDSEPWVEVWASGDGYAVDLRTT